MKIHIAIAVVALAVVHDAVGQSSVVEHQILAARDTVWRAWYTNDTALLRRFIPPAAASAEGSAQMRWNNRKDIVDGARGFVASKARLVDVSFDNTEIERTGQTALVRSMFRVVTESGSKRDTVRGRATELFVRQGSTWLNPYHWNFDKKPGGGLVEDHWRADNPSIPMTLSLYTYRSFDPQRKVWFMLGTSSYGGQVEPGLTWSDGAARLAIQRDRGGIVRIRYLAITEDSFLWRSDRSVDGGKTWLLDSGTMEAKRIGK